ncbi:MAG TPA: BatA domain-containing protein [Chthoniobacteraceae bacterium]|jgi:hypothetical protein|nr:BatA domain-containing protein [Chthoniobacteraceae bacterium]
MTFLAPLFLLGGLAIIGPVIFHLIRRTTKDVVPFSSLMFLVATPPRMTKRSRLENLWLLLLRILVILLLAIGFGRPLLQRMTAATQSPDAGKRTVVLIDTSASMRREDLWPRAQAKLREVLTGLGAQDGVAVVAFDRTERTLVSFEQWAQETGGARVERATQQAAAMTPTWSATALGAALLHASELLNAAPDASRYVREIVVISDFQEGSKLEGLQGYQWPKGTEVALEPIQPAHLENARAEWVASDSVAVEAAKAEAIEPLRIRVTNEAGAAREQFSLRWSGGGEATVAYVPAGQSRIVTVPPPAAATGDKLLLTGDETAFDDETFVVPPRPDQTLLLFAGNESPDDTQQSLYFLRNAFPATRREKIEVRAHPGSEALPIGELSLAQLVVLGEGLTEPAVASARGFAEGGRIALYPLTSAAGAQALGRLIGVPDLQATEASLSDYAMLAHIDFQHPLFSAFADPRYSDFSKIHFWKHRKLDVAKIPGARVLAQFDSGDPAILQIPLGKGSVIVFASSWRPADSQLALSATKFVPLLNAMLAASGGRPPRQDQYFVGDPVPMRPGAQPWIVSTPGGKKIEAAPETNFTGTDEPGLYTISPGGLSFAVNLAAEESRTNPLPLDRLTQLEVPTRGATAKARSDPRAVAEAKRAEDESRQKLWRWLMGAAVAFILIETLLAALVDRRPQAA